MLHGLAFGHEEDGALPSTYNESILILPMYKIVKYTEKMKSDTDIEQLTNALFRKSTMGLQHSKESWGRAAVLVSLLQYTVASVLIHHSEPYLPLA